MRPSDNRTIWILCAVLLTSLCATPQSTQAQYGLDLERDTLNQTVLIHPPVDASGARFSLSTREHTYRSQLRLGDQLARDFTLMRVGSDGIPRAYEPGTAGKENEDWFGWRRDVLAPFDGTVTRVEAPDTANTPGTMNREAQPGLIFFETDEGTTVIYVHVREIEVEEGQRVPTGAVVAKVGNNATSRAPHVHVGAWKDETPLQIQVDLYAAERSGTDAEDND